MNKRQSANCLCFFFICLISLGLVGSVFPYTAFSETHVFRASISPRPESPSAPAASEAPKQEVQAVKPAASSGKSVTAAETAKPAKKSPKVVKRKVVKTDAPAAKTSGKAVAKKSDKASAKVAAKQTKSVSKSRKSAKASSKKTVVAKAAVPAALVDNAPAAPMGAAVPKDVTQGTASAKDLYLNVKAAFLVNMTTGKVYYEHNPDKAIPPASITKLLTLYLVREAMAQGTISQSTAIPVSAKAVTTGGSRMRLKRGEKVPLSELIKGISVVSANNACVAVAEYMGQGDPSRFVSQMNAKARSIGMTSSLFMNPNGLPAPGQLSTARDIAKLSMSYLRAFPESLNVHSMTTHTYHGATHRNANSLLRTYKGVDGLKTGFVCASGYNITATAKRGNTRLVAVVLGAQNSSVRQRETAKLLDYGFRRAAIDEGLGNRADAPPKKPEA